MKFVILDCYTDEPSGLGVPPYLGTYPRYLAGAIKEVGHEVVYLNIDDLRAHVKGLENTKERLEKEMKTDIRVRNLTPNYENILKILDKSILFVNAGVHTPGTYLSAYPGTTSEVTSLLSQLAVKPFTVLCGPAAHLGSGLWGGRVARDAKRDNEQFDLVVPDVEFKIKELIENNFTKNVFVDTSYAELRKKAIIGAEIAKQYPLSSDFMIAEIETMRGCAKAIGCSFCTEPLKSKVMRRPIIDIIEEVKALREAGVRNFRLGKQTCLYSYGTNEEIEQLLKGCKQYADVLHLDNCNPAFVTEEKTKTIVKYMTSGNIAAFGVESFDKEVVKKNKLNTTPEHTYRAIKIINKYGAEKGENGMPKFLPGINLIYGLIGESKKTHEENMFWLRKILDEDLLLRRINIRQVVIFAGTLMEKEGGKELRKNKKHFWSWRKQIRQEIDHPMLKKLVPVGSVLKNLRTEVYDGKTTFARQVGTYPIAVGIKGRVGLDKFVDVKITAHMLRSLTGELVE